jgi:hypothetical protein
MNVAQSIPIPELDQKGFFPKDERKLSAAFTDKVDGKDALGMTLTEHHASEDFDNSPVGIVTQVKMLFTRELKNVRRDKVALGARFGLTIFLSVLIGVIFLDVGEAPNTPPSVS